MSVVVLEEEDLRRILREELRSVLADRPQGREDRRVTYAAAAAAADVSVATIKAWKAEGRLRAFGEGRNTRFSLAEVLAVVPLPAESKQTSGQKAEEILRRCRG